MKEATLEQLLAGELRLALRRIKELEAEIKPLRRYAWRSEGYYAWCKVHGIKPRLPTEGRK